jgi:hypothetical protein
MIRHLSDHKQTNSMAFSPQENYTITDNLIHLNVHLHINNFHLCHVISSSE